MLVCVSLITVALKRLTFVSGLLSQRQSHIYLESRRTVAGQKRWTLVSGLHRIAPVNSLEFVTVKVLIIYFVIVIKVL